MITRDATCIEPMHVKYVILCNEKGGILNDPVLLRLSEDEFWFSLADSDLLFWLQGVNVGLRMEVEIDPRAGVRGSLPPLREPQRPARWRSPEAWTATV